MTSVAAKVVPLVAVCSHKLRRFLFVAATACEKGGGRESMQCQFSLRIVNLDHYEFGRWCLRLNAVLWRNSRVVEAVTGFRSHSSVLFDWQLAIVRR